MNYRVCIPTAGTGSRIGPLTRHLNKSLLSVANRPVLAHILEQFPADATFVIALGYKGHLVREFLEMAYPNYDFIFVEVSPFEGAGSGLGYTLLSCQPHLQTPFVFCSCDTIVSTPIPPPDHNWMGFAGVENLAPYRTLRVESGSVAEICEKGVTGRNLKAYIGLAGIHDFEEFWNAMARGGEVAICTGEIYGMHTLIDKGISAYPFLWYDTGIPESLTRTRESFRQEHSPNILDKPNEAIWFVNGQVIKFSDDTAFIANRVKRVGELGGYVPIVNGSRPYMYRYPMVEGTILSKAVTLPMFRELLETCRVFWEPHLLDEASQASFRETCLRFYRDKTWARVNLFYSNFNSQDGTEPINGEPMPLLKDMLVNLDWEWLANGRPGRFHGDFHFENILWSEDSRRFTFLDWRQDFGGSLTTGDIYYDLAKLMHGLIVTHEMIAKDQYWTKWGNGDIRYDFHRKQILVECERDFEGWLQQNGYDVRKVRTLTALIYLNIAALHHYPYCLLLYAIGKRMLKQELERN